MTKDRTNQVSIEEFRLKLDHALNILNLQDYRLLANTLIESGEFSVTEDDESVVGFLSPGLIDRKHYYAIHNKDLDLLAASAGVVASLPDLTTNPLPAIAGLLLLLYRYRRNRAKLNAIQGLILMALRKAGPNGLTTKGILVAVNRSLGWRTKRGLKLNSEIVQAGLMALKSVLLTNGQRTSFVSMRSGRWFADDV